MRPIILLLAIPLAACAGEAPGWLMELSTAKLPAYEAKVPAAVLVHEETVTLDLSGKRVRSTRYAVKVLNLEGAREAQMGDVYYTDTGRVRDMRGWLIMPSGRVKQFGKAEISDMGAGSGLYEQARYRAVDASKQADPGAVFGFESVVEETTVFSQFIFDFQEALPTLRSAFVLNLPPGWKAEGKVFRGLAIDPVEPQVSGSTYRWEMRSLPPFERESSAPARSTLNPTLNVSTFAPGSSGNGNFQTWKDVSAWTSKLMDPSAVVTPEIEAQARKLTANATSFWDKTRVLAEQAQGIRYESIQLNLSRGGGMTPRLAAMVMSKGYGDCKDKANYLRTLLKAAGIESYPVAIYSGDPRRIRKEWPSPSPFNHAILAIRVPAEVSAPAVFDFPALGKMMLFDPTDTSVAFGYIPDHEQRSFALLLAGDRGDIFEVPGTPPSLNRIERLTKGAVAPNGDLTASVSESATGQEAFDERRLFQRLSQPEYVKSIERRVSRSLTGVQMNKVEPAEDPANRAFRLGMEFNALAYAKTMQGRLMMVKPVVLSFGGLPSVVNPKRTQPLIVEPASFHERIELAVPDGFQVDELPPSSEVSSDFGSYRIAYKNEDGRIVVERQLELRSAWVPVEDYAKARGFFGAIGGSEAAPVVLVRK